MVSNDIFSCADANYMFSFTMMNRNPDELFDMHPYSMEDFYPSKNHGPDSGIGSDNGDKRLSTTEVSVHTTLTDGNANSRRACCAINVKLVEFCFSSMI